MKFDFDTITPRRHTASLKWDTAKDDNTLPMWVADMDFRTAPAIIEAIERRARHGIFGYTKIPTAYFDALTGWFISRHGFSFDPESVLVTTGVVPALSAIIRALTVPGDGVIVQTPVYNCFFSSIRNMQCERIENPLLYENGRYEIDFADLETKAANPQAKLLLLCNPHNPAGRVWTQEELSRIGSICLRHDVIVVSDEIHCEIVFPNHHYTPYATISPEFRLRSVTCTSPSKAFNLAGLQVANIIVADPDMRKKIDRALNIHEVCEINPFGMDALIAAYTYGGEWLDQLNAYIYGNYNFLREECTKHLPNILPVAQEGTYLAWLDCMRLQLPSTQIKTTLEERQGLMVAAGTTYGSNGEGFIRINMGCPRQILSQGLSRLKNAYSPTRPRT